MTQSKGTWVLVIYSGVLTLALTIGLVTGFIFVRPTARFDALTVHRINVVEPDGTLRMVISDKARFPGLIIKGKEFPHDRTTAGMLFFNDEGTENGGLIFGGYKKNGKIESWGHLSFDQYMQDQVFTIDANDSGKQHYVGLKLVDRPDYSITRDIDLRARVRGMPEAKRKAAIKAFYAKHGGYHPRLFMARLPDDVVALGLNDPEGHPRIMLKVGADGTPSIQMLDAAGKVVGEVKPRSK